MYAVKRAFKLLLAFVFLFFVVFLNLRENVSTLSTPKKYNSLGKGGSAKQASTLQTRNDWSKDCIISSTEDSDNSIYNSCLRKLDLSEKMNCDTSCQESIQKYRKMSTKRACISNSKTSHPSIWDDKGNLQKSQQERLNHLYPIENSNLIYCGIPKDGSSAWKRILLTVTGNIDSPASFKGDIHPIFKENIKSLASYNVTEAQRRLKTYKKFLFVREPMERLLSLFLEKAVHRGVLPFNESQFESFLNFIINGTLSITANGFDEHWAHASYLCLPCDISYDFIGRLETSKRDSQYIFDHFIQEHRDRLKMYENTDHFTHSSDPVKKNKYYQQASKDVLRKVIDKYDLDYVLFNYDKPSF